MNAIGLFVQHFYSRHPYWAMAVTFWVLNAIISSLPTPKPTSSKFYGAFFTISHACILAIGRLIVHFLPQVAVILGIMTQDDADAVKVKNAVGLDSNPNTFQKIGGSGGQ